MDGGGKYQENPWQSDEEPQNHAMNGETHETRERSPMETSATIYMLRTDVHVHRHLYVYSHEFTIIATQNQTCPP